MKFGVQFWLFSPVPGAIALALLVAMPPASQARPFPHPEPTLTAAPPFPQLIAQASRTVGGSPATGRTTGGGSDFTMTYDASRSVSGAGAGGRSQGGGVRSGIAAVCPTPEVPLTALVPFEATYAPSKNIPETMNVWGTTTQQHPTFWAYVPAIDPSISVTFLLSEGRNLIHQTTVQPPSQGGVIPVTVPTSAPALEPGKRYQWTLSFQCKAAEAGSGAASSAKTETVYVQASVFYAPLAPAIASQLTPKPSRQNAALYAQNGIWYDALTTLATLRQQAPNDATLQADWATLLNSMVLSPAASPYFDVQKLAQQPLAR